MNVIPESIIIRRWYQALGRLRQGTLHFTAPNGERQTFHGKQPGVEADFAISHWDVIRRMVARGDIAMGEDYIAGLWTTSNIESLFSLFLINLRELEGFAHGNIINKAMLSMQNHLVRRNSRDGSSRNIKAHYDVGNEFYSLWLDPSMTYSSALYEGTDDLTQAQVNKYQRIISRCEKDGAKLLEVGCGWGGFAEQALRSAHNVTGLTISPAQHAFATERLAGGADIRLQDYRDVRGTFDMIVSIEMFEAVGEGYWPAYFTMLKERMAEGGKAIIQTITIRDELYAAYRTQSDFIRHYVFPGGMLPSLLRFREEASKAGLQVKEVFTFGQDYARTLRSWDKRMEAQRGAIMALGHNAAFMRNWHYYLGMCAAAFAVGRTDVAQIELTHAA